MMIVMTPGATAEQVAAVRERLADDRRPRRRDAGRADDGDRRDRRPAGRRRARRSRACPASTASSRSAARTSSRRPSSAPTRRRSFDIAGRTVGGGETFCLIAGPCTVESRDADARRRAGGQGAPARRCCAAARSSRAPRRSRSSGLGAEALEILAEAREATGLPVVTELLDAQHADAIAEHADVVQIGARNMQNYALLEVAGKLGKPVLLKRGLSSTPRRAAHGRRLHPQGGQRGGDPLRARHPHVRDGDALHARPRRGAVAQAAHAPAGRSSTRATRPATAAWSSR